MLWPQALNSLRGMPVSPRNQHALDSYYSWETWNHTGEHCSRVLSNPSLSSSSSTTSRKSKHRTSPLLQKSKSHSHTPAALRRLVWAKKPPPARGTGLTVTYSHGRCCLSTRLGRRSASRLGRTRDGKAAVGHALPSSTQTPRVSSRARPAGPPPAARSGVALTAGPGTRGSRRAAGSRRARHRRPPGDAAPSSSGASGGTRGAAWARRRRRDGGGGRRPPPRAPSPRTRCGRRGAGSGRAAPCRAPRGSARGSPAGSRGGSGSGGSTALSGSPRAWTGRRWQPSAPVYVFNKEIPSLRPSLPTAGRVGPSPRSEPRRAAAGGLPAARTGRERPTCDPCPGCALGAIILLLFSANPGVCPAPWTLVQGAEKGCAPAGGSASSRGRPPAPPHLRRKA